MATLNVQNIPDEIYTQIQSLAAEHGRSIDEQVISLLQQALRHELASRKQLELMAEFRGRQAASPEGDVTFDSAEILGEAPDR